MPKLPTKPTERMRPDESEPTDWLPLSNTEDHHGRKVIITYPPSPYQGKRGVITRADTAYNGKYRGLYCTIELQNGVILTEVRWDDFLQVHD